MRARTLHTSTIVCVALATIAMLAGVLPMLHDYASLAWAVAGALYLTAVILAITASIAALGTERNHD